MGSLQPKLAGNLLVGCSKILAASSPNSPTFTTSDDDVCVHNHTTPPFAMNGSRRRSLLPMIVAAASLATCASFSSHLVHPVVQLTSYPSQSSLFTSYARPFHRRSSSLLLSNDSVLNTPNNPELLQSLRSLRVKELKSQLDALNVSSNDVFEKEELVQRLYQHLSSRQSDDGNSGSNSAGYDDVKRKKKKKRRVYDDDADDASDSIGGVAKEQASVQSTTNQSPHTTANANTKEQTTNDDRWTITAPFQYYTLSQQSIAAKNDQDIYIRPSPGKYAAITVNLQSKSSPSSEVNYNLLVDTACSGIVLSPSAVSRGQRLEVIQLVNSGAASMTTAGGVDQGGFNIAKWGDSTSTKFIVGGVDVNELNTGRSNVMMNMAAVQDISALPSGLDGIMGLSFLNSFPCVDFDFGINGQLRLHKSDSNPPIPTNDELSIVGSAPMTLTRLGIYTVDVTLDGRGPVKLLVDTGAASSFLNWKGVSDLGMSRSSPQIEPIRDSIGAMGADNMALELTHRYVLQRRWNIVDGKGCNGGEYTLGVGLRNTSFSTINIDIADLPVLETLKGEGVGGILGADLLMMCEVVRFTGMNGSSPRMTMMKR